MFLQFEGNFVDGQKTQIPNSFLKLRRLGDALYVEKSLLFSVIFHAAEQ